jgi:DNA modification methylase
MPKQTVLSGHVLDRLAELPDKHFHCCVTSPPFYALRDYRVEPKIWPDGWVGQLGLEPTVGMYVDHMRSVAAAVGRVLRDDGTFWLNLGDTYVTTSTKSAPRSAHVGAGWKHDDRAPTAYAGRSGLPAKNLIGVPWLVALALQADGWILRMDHVWWKQTPVPESCVDRATRAHEYVFLLVKQGRYYYDKWAVTERGRQDGDTNMRSVWSLPHEPNGTAHFAPFPSEIPRRAILAGTSEAGCCPACGAPWRRLVRKDRIPDRPNRVQGRDRDALVDGHGTDGRAGKRMAVKAHTIGWARGCGCDPDAQPVPCRVLDPFVGTGTTLRTADGLGRHGWGIDLNDEYVDHAVERIGANGRLFTIVEIA